MKRQACSMCQGTDTQRECEQGQCYAEHYENEWHRQREIDAEEDWRRRCDEERDQ